MTICGADCSKCGMKETCKGCMETQGQPFGGVCVVADCCRGGGHETCAECNLCEYKARLMAEFNGLGIKDMPPVTELYALNGAFVNLEYELPGGGRVKFWKDENIYLGSQLPKVGSERCYGLTADDRYLLVCEYGENGAEPQIVVFKRREK